MGQPERYLVIFTRRGEKDLREIMSSELREKAIQLLTLLRDDPFSASPPYEKLRGRMKEYYSRRLNREHRLVYRVLQSNDPAYKGIVEIVRMKTHYEGILPLFLL
ncbi:MAG: Txe/YoeB family addiction module toxin [Methanomassiliicoccaceae archaeon]|jgi:Txe/YoeB family toxin of toxin-antitoxin system|nr:Txe/YoeB family addiction module toxin [Methanomassiliicoccaceae archaeon]